MAWSIIAEDTGKWVVEETNDYIREEGKLEASLTGFIFGAEVTNGVAREVVAIEIDGEWKAWMDSREEEEFSADDLVFDDEGEVGLIDLAYDAILGKPFGKGEGELVLERRGTEEDIRAWLKNL